MSPGPDTLTILEAALKIDLEGDNERILAEFLGEIGFSYPVRSATNIRLLADCLPAANLPLVLEAALAAAMPDMALNNLERISTVVPADVLLLTCSDRSRVHRLCSILGASLFLTNIICRDPGAFVELFDANSSLLQNFLTQTVSKHAAAMKKCSPHSGSSSTRT